MKRKPNDSFAIYHHVTESVKKHLHFLNECNPEDNEISSLVGFNNRLIISDCKAFLEAIKSEIGGEILEDSKIGKFLYYGELTE